MHYRLILRILGVLLMVFSITMVPPSLVSLYYHDGAHFAFFLAFGVTLFTGIMIWLPFHNLQQDLRTRDGFLVTAGFWVVLGLFGALPFLFSQQPLSFADALFESMSGLTTTGATVIQGLDELPRSILYYRQQLQWLGGIGIVVIAVAILPMLGIGGMQLYKAETPGPVKDSKLTPRITETAKALFIIYLFLTVCCVIAYWAVGMTLFDAIGHAFSTVSIGGFSTHDESIGFFDSNAVMIVCMIFMLLSGINFALHFFSWQNYSIRHYWHDPEFRFYLRAILIGIFVTVAFLIYNRNYEHFSDALVIGSFEFISVMTTTGFGVADFSSWPTFLPTFLILAAFMGGCAGSTGGGMKVIRVLLLLKQGSREIRRLIHSNAVIPIKIGNKSVSERVVDAVWGFLAVYIFAFFMLVLLLLATGLDFHTAWSAVGACINNLGPGLGKVALHYADINDAAKWILSFTMLLGRLEIFTLLVLFSPTFWRH